jgi:hypothetical protein
VLLALRNGWISLEDTYRNAPAHVADAPERPPATPRA